MEDKLDTKNCNEGENNKDNKCKKNKAINKKHIRNIIIIFIVVILLEIFVFNFGTIRSLFFKDEISYLEDDFSSIEYTEDYTYVLIDNVGTEIKSLNVKIQNVDYVEYEFLYTDDTSSNFRALPSKTYVDDLVNSKYISTYLSGDTNKLGLIIYSPDAKVSEINVNVKIPMNFTTSRSLILFLIFTFMYSLFNFNIFKVRYMKNNSMQNLILIVVLYVFFLASLYITSYSSGYLEGDYYSYDFIDSLSNGQLYLDQEPSEKLLSLDNPYDYTQRDAEELERGTDYIWDAALYNGKFYVYFGILPALVLLVPIHALTGAYLPTSLAVFIFTTLTSISLMFLFKNIFIKYFKKIPFRYMVLSLAILLFGSQILVLNGAARFYELSLASGMFFAITGLNFMFVYLKNHKIRYLFLASLFLSLSVACRPTMLFVSIIFLIVVIKELIKHFNTVRDKLKVIVLCAIPYIIVGVLLMIYNYVRFDSIFEFGTAYQLTINDMSSLKHRIATIGVGLVCNLFTLPTFKLGFPFIETNSKLLSFYGYYYIGDMLGGLFMLVPICFSFFAIWKVCKYSKNKDLKNMTLLFALDGLLIVILSIIMAGSLPRYIADYAWLLILASIMIILELMNMAKGKDAKALIGKIILLLAIYIIFINFFAGIVSEHSYFKILSPTEYFKLEYLINFWE